MRTSEVARMSTGGCCHGAQVEDDSGSKRAIPDDFEGDGNPKRKSGPLETQQVVSVEKTDMERDLEGKCCEKGEKIISDLQARVAYLEMRNGKLQGFIKFKNEAIRGLDAELRAAKQK